METETLEDILRIAEAAGYSVQPRLIYKYREAGLLSEPQHPGYGRRYALYPAGTGDQLVAICRLKESERNLPDVAWRLWWDGWPVRTEQVRLQIEVQAEAAAEWIERLRGKEPGDISEVGERLHENAAQERLRPGPIAEIRKRVKPAGFSEVVLNFMLVSLGWFTSGDTNILHRAFGTDRAMKDRVFGCSPWYQGDLIADLREISRLISETDWRQIVMSATPSRLEEVRDFAKAFTAILRVVTDELRRRCEKRDGGLNVIRSFFEIDDPDKQACIVLALLALWSWGLGDKLKQAIAVRIDERKTP